MAWGPLGLDMEAWTAEPHRLFLPSQRAVPSLGSGIKLVAQGRKYGLGMIVATQVPRGIHNQVVSNCTTQFFGCQSAPATIAAAQEIIAANGGSAGASDRGSPRAMTSTDEGCAALRFFVMPP